MKTPPPKKLTDKRNKVCTSLGMSLKAKRLAAEKSQETLGFEAQVDRTYISQIERGVGNPSVLTLANICFALGITLADLFEPVNVALEPGIPARRVNPPRPVKKPVKTRLR
jgi:transcriptional regulator with XRE-family HTH domain